MRKSQRKQAKIFIQTVYLAHDALDRLREEKQTEDACLILEDCQQGMIQLGNMIEQAEGNDFAAVHLIEQYCETVYQAYQLLQTNEYDNMAGIHTQMSQLLLQIERSIKNTSSTRYEIVFMPYKASMWDSLESVWQAADADPDCDVYVIPIPYYDKNPDGSFGTRHYEGKNFPDYVPVTHYDAYDMAERQPDVIYIHNPYDDCNYVTSVDPLYYSKELKKYTSCLVYIPYYATSGGMSEGQASCPAYAHADYIIIQAEKYRKFFDPKLPSEKLVPLGSPKFDRVINICKNPSAPPDSWDKKLKGKRIYFYNTSITGMLANTERFLQKMDYVFTCFKGRTDVCLIWRPHPLLEATFQSMRKELYPVYKKLKKRFKDHDIGIYDDTPDITETIALCDAYIGDTGTSVTSLFGIAGKPLFILNNIIHSKPEKNDWRGEIIRAFQPDSQDNFMITQGNRLYYAPKHDYQYTFYCNLSKYAYGRYYIKAISFGRKIYICPGNAQDLLILCDKKIEKSIPLKHEVERAGAFADAQQIGHYLFLIPNRYPAIVRYNLKNSQIDYIRGYNHIFVQYVHNEWKVGGRCVWNQYLLIASPTDNRVVAIDSSSGKGQLLTTGASNTCGCLNMLFDKTDIWMLPYEGTVITRWNPLTGTVREFSAAPADFKCRNSVNGYMCNDRPFSMPAFYKNYVIIPPYWGNMYLRLDKNTGDIEKWELPFDTDLNKNNTYFIPQYAAYTGAFLYKTNTLGPWTYRFFYFPARKLYDINLETNEYKEIAIHFNPDEVKKQEPGFCEVSDWMHYSCSENAFNSLDSFLDGNIQGASFDNERQLRDYRKIAANSDGTSGLKIHQFTREQL